MANPAPIEGVFEPVDLWQTKSGEIFTHKQLAEYRARKDGDSSPLNGSYPIGPTPRGLGYRRKSDGKIFMIQEIPNIGDDRAREDIAEDLRYLASIDT